MLFLAICKFYQILSPNCKRNKVSSCIDSSPTFCWPCKNISKQQYIRYTLLVLQKCMMFLALCQFYQILSPNFKVKKVSSCIDSLPTFCWPCKNIYKQQSIRETLLVLQESTLNHAVPCYLQILSNFITQLQTK